MPLTYNEFYGGQTGLTVGVNRVLFSEETPYQTVEVYDTDSWGNLMTIDGMVMLSERDEFVYHEMLSHVPLFTHPRPERVLIIGGGDGGTAREVMRHDTVRQVDLVEIDEAVVRASKRHLPEVGDWENPKLNVLYENGITFVRKIREPYDVIIVDGSDPAGPAEGLFGEEFIRDCHRALSADGVLAAQTESPWIPHYHDSMKKVFAAMDSIYELSALYLAYIPLYPAGMWSFTFAGRGPDPLGTRTVDRMESGLKRFGDDLKYYNRKVHRGCFALPNFVAEIIR